MWFSLLSIANWQYLMTKTVFESLKDLAIESMQISSIVPICLFLFYYVLFIFDVVSV